VLRTTILLLLALAVVGCGGDGETDKPIEPPPFDNTGGTDQGTDPCDLDGDGFAAAHCGGLDCNDLAPDVHPDAAEICDGVEDENCDGSVDEGCDCSPSDARACFPGQEGRNVGLCRDGVQHCSADGTWGPCEGAVVPQPEGDLCDGLDQDCNGTADDGLTNACGLCGETPAELCGNGLDDDCNGIIDDPAVCSVDCSSADPESPGALACCVRAFDGQASATTPSRHAFACDEWEGLEACETRACEDLDPDDDVLCESRCTEEGCVCGKIVDEEILPHVPIPALRCYGLIEDGDPALGWVFMEDAGDAAATRSHDALIARWLGTVHAAGAERARRLLPERGAAQYLAQLRAGRARIAAHLARAAAPPDEGAVLSRVVARCDEIEARWPEIDAACAQLPPVLVHGDIKRKNLRPWNRRGRDELLVLDWELAGWGTPVPELERLSGDRTGGEATALARLYLEHAGWERVGPREVERLAWIGAVVRLVACIDWAGMELEGGREDKAMRQLRHYDERLAVLLRGPR